MSKLTFNSGVEYYDLEHNGVNYEVLVDTSLNDHCQIMRSIQAVRLEGQEVDYYDIDLFNTLIRFIEKHLIMS